MSDIILQDAEDFEKKLKSKIRGCKKKQEEKKCNERCIGNSHKSKVYCDGKEIKDYLDIVVPDWKDMKETRLYKHIQKMLDNADKNRQFSIELIWKRAVYSVTLLFPFFTAFAYLIYNWDVLEVDILKSTVSSVKNKTTDLQKLTLIFFALTNWVLSILALIISKEGYRWQRNWEYHVDYLQEILGIRLMRLSLREPALLFSLGHAHRITVWIPVFIWAGIYVFLTVLFFSQDYRNADNLNFVILLLGIGLSVVTIFLSFIPHYLLHILIKLKNELSRLNENVHMRSLEIFDFKKIERKTSIVKVKEWLRKKIKLFR